MTHRSHLYLLVAAALAPMVAFAVAAAVLLQKDERDTMARDAIGRARSAMSAVDSHLRGTVLALRTLAASKNLESGDIAAFHAESQRVLRGEPNWVNIGLIDAKKQVLFNAVYAFGKAEPVPALDDSLETTANGTRIGFGAVRPGSVVRNPTVRVHLPVAFNGEMRYILSAPLSLKLIAEVLQAQHLPEGWTIALMDHNGQLISGLPAGVTGSAASEDTRKVIERAPEDFVRSGVAERSVYTAHVTSELSGWVLAIGIPASYVEAGAKRSFAILALGALAALAMGLSLAWLVARRIPAGGAG